MAATIPFGGTTVKTSIISPNRVLSVPPEAFVSPTIKGTTYSDTPCLSSLTEHEDVTDGKISRLLFDLGIRSDWESNLPPVTLNAIKSMPTIRIIAPSEEDVPAQLLRHGIALESIDGIIISHWHFDHTGDPTRFLTTTKLIVGPGFAEHCLPGYPTNRESMLSQDAFDGRKIEEVSFHGADIEIAGMRAIDYFDDGSLYFLDTPGHAVGHISVLARSTLSSNSPNTDEDTFILIAGDVAHHAGELRLSKLMPLPSFADSQAEGLEHQHFVPPSAYQAINSLSCQCLTTKPFYRASSGGFNMDPDQMQETIEKVAQLDVNPNVFVVLAHDHWLVDDIDFFPELANEWKAKTWKEKTKWKS